MVPADEGHTTPSMAASFFEAKAHLQAIEEKYRHEREKRLRRNAASQYVDLATARPSQSQTADCSNTTWAENVPGHVPIRETTHARSDQPEQLNSPRQDKFRVLIVGAGFGGLLFAVRLLQSWFCIPSEIVFIDEAGGFGGTWHWNRYPGLMCDTESYIYMPLLEETGYKPTQKYVFGAELKEHADRIANNWQLNSQAKFNTSVTALNWDDENAVWKATLTTSSGTEASIKASYVFMATGLLSSPKVPRSVSKSNFEGRIFHASRWDYQYTGGSSETPEMAKLKGKTVGVIGTGATAIQVIPQLAKWAKKVYVFQRTPSAVARRNNSPTCPRWWDEGIQAQGRGWQRRRMENYNAFLSNEIPPPEVDWVYDEWTRMPSYSGLVGGPLNLQPGYLDRIRELDLIYMDEIRERVNVCVFNEKARMSLKPWYYGWCKRPCFSDEFLQTFNRSNVTLVDTNGQGIDKVTSKGISAGSVEYNLDTIILCTGFHLGGSFDRGKLFITGRNGVSLHQKWQSGISTLHGVMTNGFPNLFFLGPYQAGAGGNQMYVLDQLASHVAFIITEADRKRYANPDKSTFPKVTVEPTIAAEDAWSMQVIMRAGGVQALSYCTPGYLNHEGAMPTTSEGQVLAARACIWGTGVNDYVRVIEAWRDSPHARVQDLKVQARH